MSLLDLLGSAVVRDGVLRAHVPEGWRQGRTAYGGLSAALALEAVRQLGGHVAPLRSAQIAFVGPAEADIEVAAAPLRQGRSAAFWSADLRSPAGLGMRATFVFAEARASAVAVPANLAQPDRQADEAPAFPFPPAFAENFDYRFAQRRIETVSADLALWVRLKARHGLDPFTELLCVGDALPPAAILVAGTVGPLSSMTWQIDFQTNRPETRDGWWLLRSTANHAEGGITTQRMGIWNADGEAVAAGSQTIALFF